MKVKLNKTKNKNFISHPFSYLRQIQILDVREIIFGFTGNKFLIIFCLLKPIMILLSILKKNYNLRSMASLQAVYAGVDIGASKSKVRIETKDARLLAQFYENGMNYLLVGQDVFISNLVLLIQKITKTYGVTHLGIGVAGLGSELDKQFVLKYLEKKFPKLSCIVTSDAEILLSNNSDERSKIIVILGTGSIIIGKTTYEEVVRYGGWGFHFDTVSGAYSLGKRLIQLAIAYIEQENDDKKYYEILTKYWDNKLPENEIKKLYLNDNPISAIADLGKSIIESLEFGDPDIENILKEVIVFPLMKKLNFFYSLHHFDKPCPLYFSGGLIEKNKYLQQYFLEEIENAEIFCFMSFYLDPCIGAINLCK
jgi:N-acetylglucosamine kinase-like BadF-type ATPase